METQIQDLHMKYRCMWLWVMCGLSTYTWYNYSLYDPIQTDLYTPYVLNGAIFICYLSWDTYKMIMDARLYRTDLLIHHAVAMTVTVSCIRTIPLHMSNYMILEAISLFNYPLRNYPDLLNHYRTFIILTLRMPMTTWFAVYYFPSYDLPQLKLTISPIHCNWMIFMSNLTYAFLLYDLFILYKIYKPKKIKK